MKIKMTRNWKPHYRSRWMYKASVYDSAHIYGGEESAKKAISYGFAVEVKDPNVLAKACGESRTVIKAESLKTQDVKDEQTREQLRDQVRAKAQARKAEVKDRILAKIKAQEEASKPVIKTTQVAVEAPEVEVAIEEPKVEEAKEVDVEIIEPEEKVVLHRSRQKRGN